MQQIMIKITLARPLVFIFVLKLHEFNDRTPPLSRIMKANNTFSSRCPTLFLQFFGCENYMSRGFFLIFLPLKWECEKYTGVKNTWVFTVYTKYNCWILKYHIHGTILH